MESLTNNGEVASEGELNKLSVCFSAPMWNIKAVLCGTELHYCAAQRGGNKKRGQRIWGIAEGSCRSFLSQSFLLFFLFPSTLHFPPRQLSD